MHNDSQNNLYYQFLPSDLRGSDLQKINLINLSENTIFTDGTYILFSPNNEKIIISRYNSNTKFDNKKLLINSEGTEINSVNYSGTPVWSNDNNSIFVLHGFETLEKIDTSNNSSKIFSLEVTSAETLKKIAQQTIDFIVISPDSKTLYFTSNDHLFKINLPK